MKAYPLYTDTRAPVESALALDVKTPVSHCETCKIPHARMMPADLVIEHCEVKDPTGGILVIGDMPTDSEFRAFRPFSMGPKATLRQKIEENTDLPVVYDNAIKCPAILRRGKRVPPKDKQMEQNRGYLTALIEELKPSRILCFGKEAYWSVLGSSTPPASCRRGHGFLSDHTPVFMLPPARDFTNNRFLLKRAIDDIQWALAENPPLPPWKGQAKVVETVEDALQAITEMRLAPWTTIDTETSGQQHEPEFFLITCLAAVPAGRNDAWVWDSAALTNPAVVQPLKDYLCDGKHLKAGHNYKYDVEMMAFYLKLIDEETGEILIKGVYGDSQLWAKQLDTESLCRLEYAADIIGMGGHKAENKQALVGARTKIKEARERAANSDYYQNPLPGMFSPIVQAAVDRPELDEDAFAYGLVPYTTMIRYCALDTVASDRLIGHLGPKIRADPNTRFVWETFLAPATDALAQIETWGMPCSRRKLKSFIKLMKGKVAQYLKELRNLGCDIDIGSGPQLQEFLYKKLQLPVLKLTNSGERSTDKDTLVKLLDKTGNPVLKALLKYKEVETLYTRYGVGMLPLIRSTGRIHGSLKLDGTRSGRLSSEAPNLQNIPSSGEWAKMIKGVFQPKLGYSLIQLDYSQLEYRIVAALAEDKVMQQAYLDGEDLHMRTAKTICRMAWNIEPEEVTAEHRRQAKTFSFGLLYGMTDGTLAKQIGISKTSATKIRAALMSNWTAVDEWIKQRKIFAARHGYTYTYWPDGKGGWRQARRRDLPDMGSDYDGFRITATNGSYNTAVQGTASDYMLLTLTRVVPWLIGSEIPGKVVNTVHDSIILEVRDDYVEEVIEFVKAIMENWSANGIPLVADPEVGPHWGKLMDYNKIKLAKKLIKEGYIAEEAVKVLGLAVEDGETPKTVIEPYFEMAARLAA